MYVLYGYNIVFLYYVTSYDRRSLSGCTVSGWRNRIQFKRIILRFASLLKFMKYCSGMLAHGAVKHGFVQPRV